MTYNRQHARHGVSYLIEARQSLARLLVHIEPSIDLDHHGLGTGPGPLLGRSEFVGTGDRQFAIAVHGLLLP